MAAMTCSLNARPFTSAVSLKRAPAARPRAQPVCALAREDVAKQTAGVAAGAALALSTFLGSPTMAAESRGTLPEGATAASVQKRVMSSDSMRGDGQPDKSDAAYPETSGGSDRGGVPPIAGRQNLTGTAAAPEKAK